MNEISAGIRALRHTKNIKSHQTIIQQTQHKVIRKSHNHPKAWSLMRKISWHFITAKKHKSLYGNLITVQQKATSTKEILHENWAAENISNFKRKSLTNTALQTASNLIRWENYAANNNNISQGHLRNHLKIMNSYKMISWNLVRLKKHDISDGQLVTAQNHDIS